MADDLRPFKMNHIAMNISREMAIMEGLVKPTPEEVAQYDADSRLSWERSVREWRVLDDARAALDEIADPVSRKILDLHSPVNADSADCAGCPRDRDGDLEDWPCATVEIIADHYDITLPSGYVGGRPGPEPSTMPPDGFKRVNLNRLSSFVDEAMVHALDTTTFHGVTP